MGDGLDYETYLSPYHFKTRRKADFLALAIMPGNTCNGRVTSEIGICIGIIWSAGYLEMGYRKTLHWFF